MHPPKPPSLLQTSMGIVHMLTTCAALGGMAATLTRRNHSLSGACPKCKRGKVQSGSSATYCHRCGWFLTRNEASVVAANARAELAK